MVSIALTGKGCTMRGLQKIGAAVGGSILAAGSALAATDVTAVTTAVTDAATAIGTVGAAVLVMIVGAKVFKWIRKAF